MFNQILIPVDFTPKNAIALEAARKIAAVNQSEITLLHVVETIDNLPLDEMEHFYASLERKAQSQMNALKADFRSDIPVRSAIRRGKRVDKIISFAQEHAIDLIVMSSHSVDREMPARDWGMMSHRVAALSPCSVLLAK